jgi:hypothetical protein
MLQFIVMANTLYQIATHRITALVHEMHCYSLISITYCTTSTIATITTGINGCKTQLTAETCDLRLQLGSIPALYKTLLSKHSELTEQVESLTADKIRLLEAGLVKPGDGAGDTPTSTF